MRSLSTLILATFIAASVSSAHDKAAKGTKKTDHSCCMEKAADAKGTAKKDASKACCDMDRAEMKDKREAGKMDCCLEHEKAGTTKTPDVQKETK